MIMGDTCSRRCKFCSVNSGKPALLDPEEPGDVAEAIKEWGLKYVVLTSVCRDDLSNGGDEHFANTIRAIKGLCPTIILESLIPDFKGKSSSIKKIVQSKPEVISHNIETVIRVSPKIRDNRASYEQSLYVLKKCKEMDPAIYTKSSLMLGLGETEKEIIETLEDLRSIGVDILTLGQYLQPTLFHVPVQEYIAPEQFSRFQKIAEAMGFLYVVAGPFVRSSYRAGEVFLRRLVVKSRA
jgi:lipoic acid synthetase